MFHPLLIIGYMPMTGIINNCFTYFHLGLILQHYGENGFLWNLRKLSC